MTKIFPKSRICVIDVYPSFEKGLKLAMEFATKHNVQLNSSDGKKLLLTFCLKSIENTYKTTSSTFPKVLCMSKKNINKRISNFVNTYFDKMMSCVPYPYCGTHELTSPDLEFAAENSLKTQKTQKKFNGFIDKLNLKIN